MASKLSIWNLALSHIGDGDDIDDVDEGSVEAEQCRKFYPVARDMILERHAWDFAIDTTLLAQLAEDAVGIWAYRYALPPDYIRALHVSPDLNLLSATWLTDGQYLRQLNDFQKLFEIEAADDNKPSILTNESPAYLRYIYRNENVGVYTPGFVMALSYLLASMLAGGPIVKSAKMAANQLKAYELTLSQAMVSASNSTSNRPQHMPAHLRGR